MNNMLSMAIALAADVFKTKTDKSGKPYILHCLRVMNSINQQDEELMQIAILHDVPEDTPYTINDLKNMGFSDRVCKAVDCLTHKKVDSYENYIKMISFNEDARQVKLADLKDNSDITRLKGLRKKDFERMEKYHKAYIYLQN